MRSDFINKIKEIREDSINEYMKRQDTSLLDTIYKISNILLVDAQSAQAEFTQQFARDMAKRASNIDFSKINLDALKDMDFNSSVNNYMKK